MGWVLSPGNLAAPNQYANLTHLRCVWIISFGWLCHPTSLIPESTSSATSTMNLPPLTYLLSVFYSSYTLWGCISCGHRPSTPFLGHLPCGHLPHRRELRRPHLFSYGAVWDTPHGHLPSMSLGAPWHGQFYLLKHLQLSKRILVSHLQPLVSPLLQGKYHDGAPSFVYF